MRGLIFVLLLIPGFAYGADVCPGGFVAIEEPDEFVVLSGDGTCPAGYTAVDEYDACGGGAVDYLCYIASVVRALCGAGIDKIKTSTGIVVPLYADKYTTPSVHVRYNDTVCYADLEPGNVAGTINIKFNGDVYHTLK